MLVQVEWLGATGFLTAWMTRNQNEFRVFHCQVAAAIPDCSQVRTPWTSFISQRHSSYITAIECACPNFVKNRRLFSKKLCLDAGLSLRHFFHRPAVTAALLWQSRRRPKLRTNASFITNRLGTNLSRLISGN